jgi:hypothetical protein
MVVARQTDPLNGSCVPPNESRPRWPEGRQDVAFGRDLGWRHRLVTKFLSRPSRGRNAQMNHGPAVTMGAGYALNGT